MKRRHTITLLPTGAIRVGVAALITAGVLAGCGGSRVSRPPRPVDASAVVSPSVGRGCPAVVRLSASKPVRVGQGAGALTAAGNAVWVARASAGTVTRVTDGGQRVVYLGGAPVSLAAGFGRLWVALRDSGRITTIDMRTLAPGPFVGLSVPVAVVTGPGTVWALSLDTGALYPIDPSDDAPGSPLYAPVSDPTGIVIAGDDAWVLGGANGGLAPLNIRLGQILRSGFTVPGRSLGGLSEFGRTLWLGEPARRELLRVDAPTVAVRELPAPDGLHPSATAAGPCGVWVADSSGTVVLIDPATGRSLGPPLRIGRSIADLVRSGTGVWASDPTDGTLVYVAARPTS